MTSTPRIPNDLARRRLLVGLAAAPLVALAGRDAWAAPPGLLTFEGLYESAGAAGLRLTPGAEALVGTQATIRGYMAPPLKAESDFFVLTRYPMSICPFCSSSADWPADIIVVYLAREAETLDPSRPIAVTGRLESGAAVDDATGFVSLLRLRQAAYRVS